MEKPTKKPRATKKKEKKEEKEEITSKAKTTRRSPAKRATKKKTTSAKKKEEVAETKATKKTATRKTTRKAPTQKAKAATTEKVETPKKKTISKKVEKKREPVEETKGDTNSSASTPPSKQSPAKEEKTTHKNNQRENTSRTGGRRSTSSRSSKNSKREEQHSSNDNNGGKSNTHKSSTPDHPTSPIVTIQQSVAILIDGNNIEMSIHSMLNKKKAMINFDTLVPRLLKDRGLNRLIYFREGKSISSKLAERLHNLFYGTVVPCHKSADIPLTIAATQIAEKVDTIIILSGDADYVELVKHLTSRGVRVEIAAVEQTTSHILRESADHFFAITREDCFVLG